MTQIPNKFKAASLTFSTLIATCLVMPLTVVADTSNSVDAIMEQMKSFKMPVTKVSTPEPEKIETRYVEEQKVAEPVKIEEKPVERKSSIYVEPPQLSTEKKISRPSVTKQARPQPKATKKKRKVKKRSARRQASRRQTSKRQVSKRQVSKRQANNKRSAVDYKGFDEQYLSLVFDILNEEEPASTKSVNTRPAQGGNFSGISGWIYLGKHSAGRWLSSKSLQSGNALPVAGQQYTVKAPLLNMRKTRPLNSGLGKLLQVLHVGDKVEVKRVHRSSKNNYWANIVRP